jgi:ubiquinone/menaquinone biosynthesis C-methylase UbiE
MEPDHSYDKAYFELLKGRSSFQFWARSLFFVSLHSYLKGDILDLGCGIGEVTNHVEDQNKYFGVDINPFCVNFLREKGFCAKVGSAYEIPMDASSVDVVFMSHVLEHLDDPTRALSEISRVLRPSGLLIVIVPMVKGFHSDPTHRIFYNRDLLRKLAKKNHYEVRSTSLFPFPLEVLGNFFYFFEYRMIAQKEN